MVEHILGHTAGLLSLCRGLVGQPKVLRGYRKLVEGTGEGEVEQHKQVLGILQEMEGLEVAEDGEDEETEKEAKKRKRNSSK